MPKAQFTPKPGQVDFTSIRYCPVVNCVLRYQGKVLVVKRSEKLQNYPSTWNGVSGFLDDDQDWQEKVKEELHEEMGVEADNILSMRMGEIFHEDDRERGKTWIVYPILVDVKTDVVRLDWEASVCRWLTLEEAMMLEPKTPGFKKVLEQVQVFLTK